MAGRSWFVAAGDKQEGPYSEDQFRDLIARGHVGPETYVWSEGMAAWQRAAEIPGLLSGASTPPAFSQPAVARAQGGGSSFGAGRLSTDFGMWEMLGRGLIFVLGFLFVIPAPWVATSFYRWIVTRLHVPQRPNLAFTGEPMDIWYVFIVIALLTYAGVTGISYIQLIVIPLQAYLSWMTVRWITANISSNGQPLGLNFTGPVWSYIGWYVLLNISFITIIGWAWVTTAWMRWMCRNVEGTRREIFFNASGLQLLWRTLVFGLASAFIIPIPWVLRWYGHWYISQFSVGEPIEN